MSKNTILSILLASSIGASTVGINAGLMDDFKEICYGKTATQKAIDAVKGFTKGFGKYFTKKLPKAVIKKGPKALTGAFIYLLADKGARLLWNSATTPYSLAVNALQNGENGGNLTYEQLQTIIIANKLHKAETQEGYIKDLQEQLEQHKKMIELLKEALTSGYTLEDETTDK